MFGTNKPMKQQVDSDGSTLDVVEIFSSIQGEGIYTGRPAIFIRLCGCGLQCYFCDTDFDFISKEQDTLTVKQIIDTVKGYKKT